MKELSVEQKAKAYNEALERAKIWQNHLYETNDKDYADELNYIFPELRESEDERIRKRLLTNFSALGKEEWGGLKVRDICAWLERQGETFTKRDVDDAYLKGVCDAKDELEKQGDCEPVEGEWPYTNPASTLDGEIDNMWNKLSMSGKFTALKSGFREVIHHFANWLQKQGEYKYTEEDINNAYKCADGVQYKRGYEDALKEVEKQGEQKSATIDIDKMVDDYANNEEFGKPLNCMIRAYRQGLKDAIGKVVSESAWTKEDEEMLDGIILRCEKYGHQEQINWLKSLKKRIGG